MLLDADPQNKAIATEGKYAYIHIFFKGQTVPTKLKKEEGKKNENEMKEPKKRNIKKKKEENIKK